MQQQAQQRRQLGVLQQLELVQCSSSSTAAALGVSSCGHFEALQLQSWALDGWRYRALAGGWVGGRPVVAV